LCVYYFYRTKSQLEGGGHDTWCTGTNLLNGQKDKQTFSTIQSESNICPSKGGKAQTHMIPSISRSSFKLMLVPQFMRPSQLVSFGHKSKSKHQACIVGCDHLFFFVFLLFFLLLVAFLMCFCLFGWWLKDSGWWMGCG
jgi:hypothetical protein